MGAEGFRVCDERAFPAVGLEGIGADADRLSHLILPPADCRRIREINQPTPPLPPRREVDATRRVLEEVAVPRRFLIIRRLRFGDLADQLGLRRLDRLLIDEGREPEAEL